MEQLSLFDDSISHPHRCTVVLDQELWIVDRSDGCVLTLPVIGHSGLKPVRLRGFAGGHVDVLPEGTKIEIVVECDSF